MGRFTAVVLATIAAIGTATSHATLPGLTYTMHTTRVPVGNPPPGVAVRGGPVDWTGVVVWAAGRGRMDIVAGAEPGSFEEGDYILFDSTDYITVHPLDSTFVVAPRIPPNLFDSARARLRFTNVKVSLDTLGAGDVIDGQSTHHYRITERYTLTVDMGTALSGFTPPSMETHLVTDFWFSDVATAPPTPFEKGIGDLRQFLAGMPHALSDVVSLARSGLPLGHARLRVTASARTTRPTGPPLGMDDVTDTSPMQPAEVDVARLVLPDGFTETLRPEFGALTGGKLQSPDGGAKWRTMPGRGAEHGR